MPVFRLLVAAILLAACTPTPPGGAQSSSPTSSPAASASLVPTAGAAATTSPLPTFAVDLSAPWPVVLYEAEGSIIRERTANASKEIARSCAQPTRLEARPAGLLEWCRTGQDADELRLISLPDGRVTVLASGIMASWSADVSPDGRAVAAFRLGGCPMPAATCQTRAVLIDVASRTERELLPSGYHHGATLEWTTLGLTLFQPECSDGACAGIGDRGGTFVWDGAAFKRWSDLRFVAKSGDWTLLERLTSFAREPRATVIRGPQGEKDLSAGHALAISSSGETLVWQPGPALLIRYAPDGRVLWQAALGGDVYRAIGMDALLVTLPTNKVELYDLRRMVRITPPLGSFAFAAVAR